jgi:hypothetical protein
VMTLTKKVLQAYHIAMDIEDIKLLAALQGSNYKSIVGVE